MKAQYAPAPGRNGFTIQQIADRFEVYGPNGDFSGEYLLRSTAEQRVTVLSQRAAHFSRIRR
ncbi:hypothetical protein ACFV2Z_30850 [Streptomyces sp. NPDC059688]|uniref:hypothetical protein n=1 Tax=Streptomyces sp. NPDC059688 TaxID=3346906 RepID=UPI0036C64E83